MDAIDAFPLRARGKPAIQPKKMRVGVDRLPLHGRPAQLQRHRPQLAQCCLC